MKGGIPMNIDDLNVLTVPDVAEILKISTKSAYKLFNKQGFPSFKIGNSLRVCEDSFLSWLKSQERVSKRVRR